MADDQPHRGVNANDPRNAGPIDYFRPKKVEAKDLREALSRGFKGAQLEAKILEFSEKIAKAAVKPDPPLCQPLESHPDPRNGLGTHPDIVEIMWEIDAGLPRRCRYVFWGGPALVHPETGVVFCVGFGTIGFVMRLPPEIIASAPAELAHTIDRIGGAHQKHHDISAAGPEWRFVSYKAPRLDWGRAAYAFAGEHVS